MVVKIPTVPLNNGYEMPLIGFGTANVYSTYLLLIYRFFLLGFTPIHSFPFLVYFLFSLAGPLSSIDN